MSPTFWETCDGAIRLCQIGPTVIVHVVATDRYVVIPPSGEVVSLEGKEAMLAFWELLAAYHRGKKP